MNLLKLAVAFMLAALLVGCATPPDSGKTDGNNSSNEEESDNGSTGQDNASTEEDVVQNILEQNVYHFSYDNYDLDSNDADRLSKQAVILQEAIAESGEEYKIILEGHADERGTQEYNLALGARRAESVSRFLRAKGVPAANITVTSYGEDNPVSTEITEEAFALNRRVEAKFGQ